MGAITADPLAATFVGHASVLVDLAGIRILTDPLLRDRVAHLRRHHPLTLSPAELAAVDLVLVSHAHADHLDVPSLRRLGRAVPIVVPAGAGRLLTRRGFSDVREVTAGDRLQFGPIEIEAVWAEHPPSRGPHSRVSALPLGYVVRADGVAVYFAGDTDLFDGFGGHGQLDLALVPIWGWGPTIGEGHLDPTRALEAVHLLEPAAVLPIHWGTYSPITGGLTAPAWLDRPAREFSELLATNRSATKAHVVAPGTRVVLPSARG